MTKWRRRITMTRDKVEEEGRRYNLQGGLIAVVEGRFSIEPTNGERRLRDDEMTTTGRRRRRRSQEEEEEEERT